MPHTFPAVEITNQLVGRTPIGANLMGYPPPTASTGCGGGSRVSSLLRSRRLKLALMGRTPGRTPWSARDALAPPVREDPVGCDHRGADQGGGRGRGSPPHYFVRVRSLDTAGTSAYATIAGSLQFPRHREFAVSRRHPASSAAESSKSALGSTLPGISVCFLTVPAE